MRISVMWSGVLATVVLGLASASPAQAREEVRVYVTNFAGDGISVVDPVQRVLVTQIKTGTKPHGVAIAPNGEFVVASNEGDGTVSFIDSRTHGVTASVAVGKAPHQVAVSPDSSTVLVTLNEENALAVIDVATRAVTRKVPVPAAPHIVAYGPDGATVYVTGERGMALTALRADTLEKKGMADLMALPRVFDVSGDNKTIYQTIRWFNGALVIDAATMKVVDRIALGEEQFAADGKDAHHAALNRDGGQLWIATQWDNSITIFDLRTSHSIRMTVGKDPNWIGFTPDGTLAVVSGTGSNDVTVIDARKPGVIGQVPVGAQPKRLAVGLVRVE